MLRSFIIGVILTTTPHISYAKLLGKVTSLEGVALIKSTNNIKREAFKGDLIYSDDQIETSETGLLELETTENHLINLNKNTLLEFRKYLIDKKTPEFSSIILKLSQGSIYISEAQNYSFSGSFQLKTPHTLIETINANFIVDTTNDNTVISVKKGSLRLINPLLNTSFVVNANETVEVSNTSSPKLIPQMIKLWFDKNHPLLPPQINNTDRPRLENYSSYGKFMQALYLYRKAEEEAKKPTIIVPNLPQKTSLDYTLVDDNYEVINWGESLSNLKISNEQLINIDLVQQKKRMSLMSSSEMQTYSVRNNFGVNFFYLLDLLNIKQEELDKILNSNPAQEVLNYYSQSNNIKYKKMKDNFKDNTIGNSVNIIGSEINQPEITVIKRP